MATNRTFTQGVRAAAKPGAGKEATYPVPVLAVVKANVDPIRAGRIWVFISNSNALDPDDSKNWVAVRFLSPFFGSTRSDSPDEGYGNFKGNPSSYGMWNSPPDIGTTVVCLFVNGDPNYGFYIGALPEPENLHMVPAIAASDKIIANGGEAQSYGGATRLPVTNMNINDKAKADSPNFINESKPIHSYQAAIMNRQGLLRDPVRGPISSSAQRESPSRVGWGVSTPGRPIYQGGYDDVSIADALKNESPDKLRVVARRGGHTFVMDDGDVAGRDQLIRIRSADGHQILMSDDGQTLMIIHKNGQSYVELGKEGTVDIYSTNSVNIRTHGDLNFHADRNVNIHAAKDFNLFADNINLQSVKAYNQLVGTDYLNSTYGIHTTQVKGAYAVESGGQASMAASAEAFVNGSKVNLNSGSCSTKAKSVNVLPLTKHTDTLHDPQKGFIAAPLKLISVTSRAPAHTPWSAAGMGVDVKVNLGADANLPAAPPDALQATNETASTSLSNPLAPATAASQPDVGAVSKAIDKGATNAVLGSVATAASAGPLAAAQTAGVAVANVGGKVQAAVGQYAMSPTQMASTGVMKPGSGSIASALIASGAKPSAAMAQNLFTGTPGAQNLQSFANNVKAQGAAVVAGLSQAQSALTSAGVMTGKEASSQVAGLVQSGFSQGISTTVNAVAGVAGQIEGKLNNLGAAANGAFKNIAQGNFAAGLADELNGVMGSLASSVGAMAQSPDIGAAIDSTRGAAAAAFGAIAASLTPFVPGVPQNLTAIAKEAALKTAAQGAGNAVQDFQNAAQKVLGAKQPGFASGLAQAAGALASVAPNSKAGALLGALSGGASSVAGNLGAAAGLKSAVTGAVQGAISGAVNKTLTNSLGKTGAAIAQITGVSNAISGVANQAVSGLTNALTSPSSAVKNAFSSATAGAVGQITQTAQNFANPTSLVNSVTGGANDLKNAAVAAASGGLSNFGASIASGVNKLPGGQAAIGQVVDNAANKLLNKLPTGAKELGDLAKNQFTAALNSVPPTPPALDDLTALISTGLPPAAAAQLQASIAAAGGGGVVPIKAPTLAFNTLDGAIDSALDSLLGDPAIPKPNFGSLSKALVDESASKIQGISSEQFDAASELLKIYLKQNKLQEKVAKAQKAYEKSEQKLPQGDPKLTELKQKWDQAIEESNKYEEETKDKVEKLRVTSGTT